MGANAQKEISFLSHLSKPDIGFITNFGKAHLEGFGGPEGVIIGKSELFDYLRANGKMAWVNLRDDLQVTKSLGIEQKTFGDHSEADFIIRSATNKANSLVAVEFENAVIQSKLTGAYNFTNLAIAVSLAAHFGVETKAIKKGIEGYQPENNRSQLEPGKKNLLLKDYYNANPSSMDAAIINFKQITEKKAKDKWLILGDMFELGTFEAEEHQRVADLALSLVCDKTILVGKAFARTKGQALRFETTLEAENWILTHLPEGKLILIKGSRGMALESIAALL
jgi:UDP-N-acetylmuramoyl-tripeptide--D-alanyl-D-alanine ligase